MAVRARGSREGVLSRAIGLTDSAAHAGAPSQTDLEMQEARRQAERRAMRLGGPSSAPVQKVGGHDPSAVQPATPAELIPLPDKQAAAADGQAHPTKPTTPQKATQQVEPANAASPKTAQSQPVKAKPSAEIPDNLSIPQFLRREHKLQPPAYATKPNGSVPAQQDEQAKDVGFAASQRFAGSAAEELSGRQPRQDHEPAQEDVAASAQHVDPAGDYLNEGQVPQQQLLAQDDHVAAPPAQYALGEDEIVTPTTHNKPAPDAGVVGRRQGAQSVQIQPQAHDLSPRFDHEMALKFYNEIRPDGVI